MYQLRCCFTDTSWYISTNPLSEYSIFSETVVKTIKVCFCTNLNYSYYAMSTVGPLMLASVADVLCFCCSIAAAHPAKNTRNNYLKNMSESSAF